MDARLPPGLAGTFLVPFSLWLMKRTLVSNPLIRPWEDVARLADDFTMQQYMLGSWYICRAVKPTTTAADGRPAVDSLPLPA
jgi:hypothetical protein